MTKRQTSFIFLGVIALIAVVGSFVPVVVKAQYYDYETYGYDQSYYNQTPYYADQYYSDPAYYAPSYSSYYYQTPVSTPTYQYPEYTYPTYQYQSYQYPTYQKPIYYPTPSPVYSQPAYVYPPYYTLPALTVYCSANVTSTRAGGYVTWSAYATGGVGGYSYKWTGENVPNINTPSISVYYTTAGTKAPVLTVRSGNMKATKACDSITVLSPTYHSYPTWGY